MVKPQRYRSFILTATGLQKLQERIQTLQHKTRLRYSPRAISERSQLIHSDGLHPDTVRKILNGQVGVDKSSLELVFQVLELELEEGDYASARLDDGVGGEQIAANRNSPKAGDRQDWREAVEVPVFFGRAAELALLEQWVVRDRCRSIAILGIGGIGKTALAVKLAEQLEREFEFLVWKSLRDAPPVGEIVWELLQFFSQGLRELPQIGSAIDQLLEHLQAARCLLVLDNAESVLCGGEYVGKYRAGCEGYGELLRCLGERHHQSCVLLTSREKPREVALLEGQAVRSLQLAGLEPAAAEELFQSQGLGSQLQWQVAQHYGGNPLALRMVAAAIQEYLDGDVAAFLDYVRQGGSVFGDLQDLLQRQFERLTELEYQVMCWLAVYREGMMLLELHEAIATVSASELLSAMQSLGRRSLIEKRGAFTLQAVVMEHVTAQLVKGVVEEIVSQSPQLLRRVALLIARGKEYVKETQKRLLLVPILESLTAQLGGPDVAQHLKMLIRTPPLARDYIAGNVLNLLVCLGVELRGSDFSQLTIWQADLRVDLQQVDLAGADLAKSAFVETFGGIYAVAFSPNGQMLAAGDVKGEIRLVRAIDGQLLMTLSEHNSYVWEVTFSPDGRTLASASSDSTVKLWDVETGECYKTLQASPNHVFSVAFSPDGQLLASSGDDRILRLWSVSTFELVRTFSGHSRWASSVVFSPDSKLLVSGSDDRTIKFWQVQTGCVNTLSGHDGRVWSVAISPDGRTLASGSEDKTVKLWDVDSGECLQTLRGHRHGVWPVAFSPDGNTLASGSWDHTLRLWDVGRGELLKTLQGHSDHIWSLAFAPDGGTVASGSLDQTVRLWSVETGRCWQTWQGYSNGVWSIALSPDGHTLVSSGSDTRVRLWDARTGQYLTALSGHAAAVTSVALSVLLASGSFDNTVKLWHLESKQCLKTLAGHTDKVYAVAFDASGLLLASASRDRTLKLWSVASGKCLSTLTGHTLHVTSVAFSPDGSLLASSSDDLTVKLWSVATGQCLHTLTGHTDRVYQIAFSPLGRMLVSASYDKTLRLWDVNGQCLQVLEGHTDWVWSVGFSPDGQTVASGGSDRTVKLWDTSTGRCVRTMLGHANRIYAIAFTPDGNTVMSGSEDETIRFWDVKTGKCLKVLRSPGPYAEMNIAGTTGLTVAQKATLITLGAVE